MSFLVNPHGFPPPGPFSPASLFGLAQWYDPSDNDTLTLSGSNVVQMNDKSGNGDHATQATALARPTLSDINGVQALNFSASGTEDNMVLPDPEGITGSQNRSLFVVFRVSSLSSDRTIIAYGAANTGQSFLLQARSTALVLGTWVNDYHAETLAPGTAAHIGGAIFGGTTLGDCTVYLDGTAEQATGAFAINTASTGTSRLGILHGIGVAGMQGQIGEVILYNRTLSAAERQKVEGYLAHKWELTANLPSDHLYKSAPP